MHWIVLMLLYFKIMKPRISIICNYIQVRDHALKMQDNIPKSDVNREYYQQNNESALAKTGGSSKSCFLLRGIFPYSCFQTCVKTWVPLCHKISNDTWARNQNVNVTNKPHYFYAQRLFSRAFVDLIISHFNRWSWRQGSQRIVDEASTNDPLLQTEQSSHLLVLGEGRM